jgi:hypothetical protein
MLLEGDGVGLAEEVEKPVYDRHIDRQVDEDGFLHEHLEGSEEVAYKDSTMCMSWLEWIAQLQVSKRIRRATTGECLGHRIRE